MHFLLINDDGIDAPGLAALEAAAASLPGARCTVVAPAGERSQCGHRVTTRQPLELRQAAGCRYSSSGSPADCVRLALFALSIKPDFVLSGINAGGNMGQDVHISGTAAGAREAAYHGLRAVAFSHYLVRSLAVDWTRAAEWTRLVLNELLMQPLEDGGFWNVNLPHLPPGPAPIPPRIHCPPCRAPLNVSYAEEAPGGEPGSRAFRYTAAYSLRPAEPGSDVAVCFGGAISVSRLSISTLLV